MEMEKIRAVVMDARVCKISDLFHKKPPGLRFNETDAFIVSARTDDGRYARATFYLSLKADGTFDEKSLGYSAAKARRHKLASFLRYYGLTDDVSSFKLKEKAAEMKGMAIEAVSTDGEPAIYVP